ncbi:MAG: DUF6588 family protein [Bacteroidota bacterium]
MKNFTTKTITILLVSLIAISHSTEAQDFGAIFEGGTEDANLYLREYTKPIMFSFNNGLGGGWYNTAKPHKLLGFDLTAAVNVANIPQSDRRFDFNDVFGGPDSNLQLLSGGPDLPTAVGGPTDARLRIPIGTTIVDPETGSSITYRENQDFDAPEGFDVEDFPIVGFPVPTVQLGIGLPKNTDLKIRYASDFGAIDDGSFTLLGFGVMHDLKQWVPGLKQIPFDFSGFIGWTRLSAEFDINEGNPGDDFEADGVAELTASSTTIQGVVSKQIAIITPYLGIGYNIAGSSLNVRGDFTYRDDSNGNNDEITITDPVSLNFKGGSSPRINAGLRIKLLVLTIHAEYTIQKYNTFTAGVGLNIR